MLWCLLYENNSPKKFNNCKMNCSKANRGIGKGAGPNAATLQWGECTSVRPRSAMWLKHIYHSRQGWQRRGGRGQHHCCNTNTAVVEYIMSQNAEQPPKQMTKCFLSHFCVFTIGKRVDFLFFFFPQQKFINQSNFTRQQGTGYDLTCWQNTLCTAVLGKKMSSGFTGSS